VARSQPPEALLAAKSAASFIRDEALLELVRQLQAGTAPGVGEPALHGLL
jgi:hypothetical protein